MKSVIDKAVSRKIKALDILKNEVYNNLKSMEDKKMQDRNNETLEDDTVPKWRRKKHNLEYLITAREIKKLLFQVVRKLGKTEDEISLFYRQELIRNGMRLSYYIRKANVIWVKNEIDFKYKRKYQYDAIAVVDFLMAEVHYLYELAPSLNKDLDKLGELLYYERGLLKGWMASTCEKAKKY